MVNLLKGRKNLEKAPAFPRFTTQDDVHSKFKKLVRYYNKVMDISTVDLTNVLEGLDAAYKCYRNRPEDYSGYKCYDLKGSDVPEIVYLSVTSILSCRAKIESGDFKHTKIFTAEGKKQVFAIVPRLAFSKESEFYSIGKDTDEHHLVGFNSVGYALLRSKIAELKREKGYDFEGAVNHIAFVEHNFVLNQKYSSQSSATIATIQTDKKYQDSELNKSTIFNQLGFRKVEVDTQKYEGKEFDYNLFRKVEEDFEEICNKLPHASAQPELKFRKLGKHKASGLYAPFLNILAVDVRNTESFIHEYGHYLDYKHGGKENYSLRDDFEHIITSYSNNFKITFQKKEDELLTRLMKASKESASGTSIVSLEEKRLSAELELLKKSNKMFDYFTTPTEIFARGFELWVFETITSNSSLLKSKEEYSNRIEYASFNGIKESLFAFFATIFPEETIKENSFAASRTILTPKREWSVVDPTNVGQQMSLF
jgi:hypothetical protein